MKRCFSLFYWLLSFAGFSQEVEFTKKLPFPDSLVSSELILSYNLNASNQLRAAVLSVNPNGDNYEYFTTVLTSDDGGISWGFIEESLSDQAADPWISGLNQNQYVISDISEGSKYHLKTFLYNGQEWNTPISHGMGHDHATILYDSGGYYLFSTQKTSSKMRFYFYSSREGTSISRSYELFNGADFSVKKPVIHEDQIAIPVVLRGDWDGKSSNRFIQMPSWLFLLDKASFKLSAPELMTIRSGAKHHVLVKDDEAALYYYYTDVARKKLEVIKRDSAKETWSEPSLIVESDYLINLDAAIWHKDQAVVVFTKEEEEGVFQKYVCILNSDLTTTITLALGARSKPDQRNGWAGRAWPQGGDYCGLISQNENIYVMWSSAPDGLFKPYFSKIRVK